MNDNEKLEEEIRNKAIEEKMKQLMEKLSPLELYKQIFEEGWDVRKKK